jgi:hypothetical protein
MHIDVWIPTEDGKEETRLPYHGLVAFVLAGMDDRGRIFTKVVANQSSVLLMTRLIENEHVNLPQQGKILEAMAAQQAKSIATASMTPEQLSKLADEVRRHAGG